MAIPANFAQAIFKPQSGSQSGARIPVHFNPVSLEFTITNTLKDQGSGNTKKQYVSKSTAKLTMQLVFDTTDTGEDVRVTTEKVGKFMEPDAKKIPPVVLFEWGSCKFQGMVESFKETVDFFAPNGVPLRATVSLSMSRQDEVFETTDGSKGFGTQRSPALDAVQLPSSPQPPGGGGGGSPSEDTTGIATRGGDPRAGRAIAAANNLDSMRFTAGASLTVGASVQLGPPVAFATGGASASAGIGISGGAGIGISGGASAGIGGGAGFGVSAGAGISAGAGFGAAGGISGGGAFGVTGGAGASAGIGLSIGGGAGVSASGTAFGVTAGASASFGGKSSARVSASAGAFAGLRAQTTVSRSVSIDPQQLLPRNDVATLGTDRGATFHVGGQASIEGSSSFRADVGANASLKARIQFEE